VRKAEYWEFFPAIIGLIQATEAIKLLLNLGESYRDVFSSTMHLQWSSAPSGLNEIPNVPICGDSRP
jgi:hypothetical protein